MLFISLVRWWYGSGWLDQVSLVQGRLDRAADFFSIELLAKTLLKPFRQIDADMSRKGSFDVVIRGMFDQLFSRLIGAMIRLVMIVVGCVAIAGEMLIGLMRLIVWPMVPVAPLICAIAVGVS
ncbi:hypothetical protein E6P97_02525 [Patescibacteria group bacterium]|nr:MAG: hypothetical protein E6P97_02525 [Patescibacteria group bacterium]